MGFKLHNWFRRRRSTEEKIAGMVLTVTEDTPADMLAGSMELLVQLPRDHSNHTERVTVERSTAMMDLLVQIATAHKLAASSYTLQAIGERGRILPHQPNTPIGALDALEVKLLPKQGTFIPRKTKQASQPFETTFRLQVHLPRNQLYVSRVSPKTNLGDILSEVCREKNLDKNKYELRHPGNHKEILDLSLSLQDYQLQEVTLYAKQGHSLGSALSSQDIMVLQRQEERRRHQAKQSIFGFMFKKSSKESSTASTESGSYGARSVSPARSDDTGRSISPLVAPVPTRPLRKRRPAPNPPTRQPTTTLTSTTTTEASRENDVVTSSNKKNCDTTEDKLVITHSRNSSDSSGYHEASVLSDNPDSAGRMPETLPRRTRPPSSKLEPRKLAQTSQASKSLCNLAISSGGLSHANSNTSLSSTGIRKKRAAPQPPVSRPLSSAISSLALERIVDSEESLTSDMGVSKPPSDIAASSETETHSKANSDIVVGSNTIKTVADLNRNKFDDESKSDLVKSLNDNCKLDHVDTGRKAPIPIEVSVVIEKKTVPAENLPMPEEVKTVEAKTIKRAGLFAPIPKPRSKGPVVPKRISSALSSQSQSVPEVTGASEEREFNLQVSDKESKQEAPELNIKNSERAGDKKEEKEEEKNDDLSVTLNLTANSSALNCNFSSRSPDMEAGRTKLDIESPWNALSSSKTPNEEQYHPFITTTASNLTLPMENLLHYRNIQEGEPHSQGTGKAGNESPTEIDRLLQKVSTTLASVLPDEEVASRSEIKTTEPEKIHARDLNSSHNNNNNINNNSNNNEAGTDPQNSTFNSQQDTSDYVSANGEDLSGTDWEYQLPDPPSAFRDDNTPAADYDGYDTITLRSVEAFKEPIAIDEDTDKNINYDTTDRAIESCRKTDRVPDDKLPECSAAGENKKDQEVELRRNVINELESKLESGSFSQGNKTADDSRKSSIETSTPKVAPIENTLPNFTISTYSRQKSLNIYDSRESTPKFKDPAEDRIVKTFATLSRNINANSISKYNKESSPGFVSSQVKDEFKTPTKVESKITPEAEEKIKAADSPPESTNTLVHRSKSYIVLTNNSKYRENKVSDEVDTCSMIKSTSVTNLNKDNTWADSNNAKILNENLQERELQSVQVLKSILPQLKSTQSSQGDKEDEDKVEVMKNDKSGQFTKVKLNSEDNSGSESSARKSEQEIKRYRYTGPPAISLGSWSERPRANVQIKMDTDYKLGVNTSGSKTVVNLNTTNDTNTSVNYTNNYVKTLPKSIKSNAINNYSNDNRKVPVKRTDSQVCSTTSATTDSNSTSTTTKSAISNNNNDCEFKQISSGKLHTRTKDEDKPVVTNVELKKSHNDKPEFKVDDDNKIDTRPVNFKELTQTFGQVNLRTKTPKYINNTNRYSDIFDPRSSESVNKNPPKLSATNGSINPIANGGKKYTSIVDIDTQHLTNGFGGHKKFNNTVTKLNGPATAPKGFKIQFNDPAKLNSNSSANFIQKEIVKVNNVPPPPTMPIITGVTLKNNNNCRKNSRPLSVPGKDPRDQLLESIRGFGRDKLRNVSTVS